jgi:autotransporter-associated beta strand protein
MEIGSSVNNDITLNGVGAFILNGPVTNSGTGTRGLTKAGAGTATLNAANSYNGATTVSGGTLEVGAAGALPAASQVTVSSNAILKFNKSSSGISVGAMTVAGTLEQNLVTITSSGAVDLTGSTLTVNGTPSLASYTLVTGNSLTGTPTLSPSITGYQIAVSGNNVLLQQIVKTTPTITITPNVGGYTYNGSYQGPGLNQVGKGGSSGAVSLSYSGRSSTTYAASSTPPTKAGDYTVTVSVAENATYSAASASANFSITKANSVINVAPTALDITDGQTLESSTLSGGSATPSSGSFAFTAPSTKPAVGTSSQSVTFTPTDTANYNAATTSVSVTVKSNGPTFDDSYKGKNMSSVAPNGLSYLMNYAFGGSDTTNPILPTQDTSDPAKLTLVAYVRTGDNTLSVTGEAAGSLDFGSTSSAPYVVITPSDAPDGMEMRSYSVGVSGDHRFLRLKASKQ